MLSRAKHLARRLQMLRSAQHDNQVLVVKNHNRPIKSGGSLFQGVVLSPFQRDGCDILFIGNLDSLLNTHLNLL